MMNEPEPDSNPMINVVNWPGEISDTLTVRSRSLFSKSTVLRTKRIPLRKSSSHVDFKNSNTATTSLPADSVKGLKDAYTSSTKSPSQLGKYTYSAKYVPKRIPAHSQGSRLRLGQEIELKRYYDIHRNKYDEMLLLKRASNSIIAVLTTACFSLKAANEAFTSPVTVWLDNPITRSKAWIGLIAETLKIVGNESAVVETSHCLNKKRILSHAKQVLNSLLNDGMESIHTTEKLAEKLGLALQDCGRSITSLITGCRSRFYQSVWQTDILAHSGNGDEDNAIDDILEPASSCISTSSLLSLNLLTPYVRWDVDGISIKKQISLSWPLIKFTSLSYPDKIDLMEDIFSGFQAFVEIPTKNIENALNAVQEMYEDPKIEITLLDHDFRTILNVLLSERYFHPAEQHKALVFGLKIQHVFRQLQSELRQVKKECRQLSEEWKRVFCNGEFTLSSISSVVDSTDVPLWKSCKDFCFQLDLNKEIDSKLQPCLKTRNVMSGSPLPVSKQPKVLIANFPQALQEHFDVLEDFEQTYEKRLQDLKERDELLIVENDIRSCTDLAQQLFFHFEHIGTSLNNFTRQLASSHSILLGYIPTDPPIVPGTYDNFSPLHPSKEFEDRISIVALTGWLAAILEMINTLDFPLSKRSRANELKSKCLQLSKSISTLAALVDTCLKYHKKAEKYIEKILTNVEKYFNLTDDNLKILSRVSSTEALPVVEESEPVGDSIVEEVSCNQQGEVSIFVTVNGVYFNQFGVMFSLRLDVTTLEHRIRIIEIFINHLSSQLQEAIYLVKSILEKFGSANLPNPLWRLLPKLSQPSMLIEGGLQEEVYTKTIFQLLKNMEAAFSKAHVKASLEIYSELEAIVLIRCTRILEEEVVNFGKTCQNVCQGLTGLEPFRKYFKKSCLDVFSNCKLSSPFDKWNNKLCCFKLLSKDDYFKNQLDRVLNSTASENVSRSSSDNHIPPAVVSKVSSSSVMVTMVEIEKHWVSSEKQLLEAIKDENALVPEETSTTSRAISVSSDFLEKSFISETEATSILIANGVTQLELETFPRRFKIVLLKKIKSLNTKLKECSAIIKHTHDVCNLKAEKVSTRIQDILSKYSHVHFQDAESAPSSLTTITGEEIVTDQTVSSKLCDRKFSTVDGSDVDVFISLNFPYDSMKLCYRGYDRSVSFRSWNTQPAEQAKILDCMLESISDQLTTIVEVSRKLTMAYVHLTRNTKKLAEKIDQSLPLHVNTLTSILRELRKIEDSVKAQRVLTALTDANNILAIVASHIMLTVGFLDKHSDLTKESDSPNNDVTLTVRNPFEKDIRQLFTKPIRIILPYSKFELKLW